ncbi:hypothetical protein QJQ45_029514 [Haematococcus lacustris]|nr:hypothetical protein QJQ45_029514 [Haematococcus lacustris]
MRSLLAPPLTADTLAGPMAAHARDLFSPAMSTYSGTPGKAAEAAAKAQSVADGSSWGGSTSDLVAAAARLSSLGAAAGVDTRLAGTRCADSLAQLLLNGVVTLKKPRGQGLLRLYTGVKAKGKECPALGFKKLQDQAPKAQTQQPPVRHGSLASLGLDFVYGNSSKMLHRGYGSGIGQRFQTGGAAPVLHRPHRLASRAGRSRNVLLASSGAVAFPPNSSEEGSQLSGEPQALFSRSLSVPNIVCARGGGDMGSSGSLGMTMERSKLQFVMPTPTVQGPKLDDGGSGGDIGKIIHNGGGGDGGDDDDDDYFNEGDDEGDGEGEAARDGFFRAVIPESYDKLSIGAVFAEWMKTVQELPAILRQAVVMGLFSSAQLVRFFAMDVRPNVTRAVSRSLPPTLARDFVGRLMADPGFVQKLAMESTIAAVASLWYEYRLRGDKLKGELDLAMINVMGMAAAAGATTWLLAPSRSYGSIQKFPWQQMLDKLPNCVFDVSGPLRQYTQQARAVGFVAKMAELSAVGALMGTTTALLSSAVVALRQRADPEWQPSAAVPNVGRSSSGLAAFFAVNANVRYQLLGGLDRVLFERTNFLWTYLLLSSSARLVSTSVGELSRAWWQGLPAPAALGAPALLQPQARRVRKKVSKKVPRALPTSPALEQPSQPALPPNSQEQLLTAAALPVFGAAAASSQYPQSAAAMDVQPLEGSLQGPPSSSTALPYPASSSQAPSHLSNQLEPLASPQGVMSDSSHLGLTLSQNAVPSSEVTMARYAPAATSTAAAAVASPDSEESLAASLQLPARQ